MITPYKCMKCGHKFVSFEQTDCPKCGGHTYNDSNEYVDTVGRLGLIKRTTPEELEATRAYIESQNKKPEHIFEQLKKDL